MSDDVAAKLVGEVGGHRFQRIPPTEKRGRIHSSSVVVYLDEISSGRPTGIEDRDLDITWFSGTGKGGQHRNRHQNCCRVTHRPTKVTAVGQSHRDRSSNLREAKSSLAAVMEKMERDASGAKSAALRSRAGTGQRGDKIRTVRFQDDTAKDHRTNLRTTASRYLGGFIDDLWD